MNRLLLPLALLVTGQAHASMDTYRHRWKTVGMRTVGQFAVQNTYRYAIDSFDVRCEFRGEARTITFQRRLDEGQTTTVDFSMPIGRIFNQSEPEIQVLFEQWKAATGDATRATQLKRDIESKGVMISADGATWLRTQPRCVVVNEVAAADAECWKITSLFERERCFGKAAIPEGSTALPVVPWQKDVPELPVQQTIQPIRPGDMLKMVESRCYYDWPGVMNVRGVVRNISGDTLEQVTVRAHGKTENLGRLNPKAQSEFKLTILYDRDVPTWPRCILGFESPRGVPIQTLFCHETNATCKYSDS